MPLNETSICKIFFKKMGQTRPLFGLFSFFSQRKDKYSTNFTINDKSIDGVLGSRTRGGMMEGTDKSTELWRHPIRQILWFDKRSLQNKWKD